MRLDETEPKVPYVEPDWYGMTESERINALLNMTANLSVVTERLINEVVDHDERIHTLELASEV